MSSVLASRRCRVGLLSIADRPWWAWILTRFLALALGGLAVALVRGNVFFDTSYYGDWVHGTLTGSRIPYRDFAWEYPPGALPAMLLPGLYAPLLPGTPPPNLYYAVYGIVWVAFMLLIDAAVLRFLLRRCRLACHHPATAVWVYGLPLLGALSWARYDLLPAAAGMLAVVGAGVGQSRRSGSLAGVGGTLKIWPVLLAPVQRTRRAALSATASAGTVMAAAAALTFLLTGQSGFTQVLHYQTRRGLQCESLAALPFVWLTHLSVPGYSLQFRFGAFEVLGPHVKLLAHVFTAIYLAGLVLLGLVHWRFMRDDAGGRLVALTAMGFLCLTIVTNRVFSPQYLLWLLAVLVAACVLDPETWRPYVRWVLLVAGLTAIMFPWYYGSILGTGWFGLSVMTVRDVLVLGIAVAVACRVVVELRALRRDQALTRLENRTSSTSSTATSPW